MATTVGASASNLAQERQPAAAIETSNHNNNNDSRRDNKRTRRENNIVNASKTHEGGTPEIRAVLGLKNESVDKKVKFSVFSEIIIIRIMKQCKNREDVIAATKYTTVGIVDKFKKHKKTKNISEEERKSGYDAEIKKKELKEHTRGLTMLEYSAKKIYSLFSVTTPIVREI